MEPAQRQRWEREIRAMGKAGAWDCQSLADLDGLRQMLDLQVINAARNLNRQGFSWAEIGSALGIARTAAHKRYAAKADL